VKKDLEGGRPWDQVAVEYSRDNTVSMHKGDLGWIQYGDKPFNIYPDVQEQIFSIPVGSWTGPIQTSGEFHFIKVLEERERAAGAPAQERARARELLVKSMRQEAEQEFANRMWERGGYSVNEDNLSWLVERILESFRRDPANNPVPVITPQDEKRVVIRSDTHPYTARMLLDRLELVNPQGRDSSIDVSDWRNLIITEWVITDEVAAYAREKGYDRDPGYNSELKKYIDGQLYARESQKIRDSVPVPTDEDLERYRAAHPEEFDVPERRSIMEVLVATREEADEILRQVKAGADLEEFAVERTIRGEAYRQRGGRFAPIRKSEFGPLGQAVFETPVGELGPVVETPLGFSVFRVLRSSPPQTISLDSIRESLRQRLLNEGRKAAEESTIQRLRKNGSVKIDEEFLREFARRAIAAAQQYKQRTSAPDSVASPDGGGVGR
jgi:parvulin-like peptidyl-prolyl isomerase